MRSKFATRFSTATLIVTQVNPLEMGWASERVLQSFKRTIIIITSLAHFDPKHPIVSACDA